LNKEFKRYECANTECFAVGILWKREATVPVRDKNTNRLLYRACPVCQEPVSGHYVSSEEIDLQWQRTEGDPRVAREAPKGE